MKRQQHTEEAIIQVLNEAPAGAPADDLCRRPSISQVTYYKWKHKYGGNTVADFAGLHEVP